MKRIDINTLLDKLKEKKVLAVISLLIAVISWSMVGQREGYTVEASFTNVPIIFKGEETLKNNAGLVITEKSAETVTLTLSGARSVLRQLRSEDIQAVVDVSAVTSDRSYMLGFELQYPNRVKPDEITIINSTVQRVSFFVDRTIVKMVDVVADFNGTTASGYIVEGGVQVSPATVRVSGPKSAVDKIKDAYINITREGVANSLRFTSEYELRGINNESVDESSLTRETQTVDVELAVLSVKTVPLDVTLTAGGGAARDENVVLRIEPSTITLKGDAAVIDSVSKLNLATIDLSGFETDYEGSYPILLPDNTNVVSGEREANVYISIVGTETKRMVIPVDNISCKGAPEGYTAEILTTRLEVVVRAPSEIINDIQPNNLYASVDLTGTSYTGDVINPYVKVRIDGFQNKAGIIGTYQIHVNILPAEPDETVKP